MSMRRLPDLVYRHRFEGAWHTSRRHSALLGYRALRDDAWRFNRTPLVLTQVDPRNKPSHGPVHTIRIHGRGAGSRRPGIPSAASGIPPAPITIGDQQGFPAAFHRNIPIAFVRDLFGLAVNT